MTSSERNRRAPAVVYPSRRAIRQHTVYWLSLSILPAVFLLLVSGTAAAQQAEDLAGTIQHLIAYVRDSGVVFERNFSSHDSVEAASHIENKYRYFKDKIDSPEKFIELCATASLVTGKQYLVITEEGDEMPAGLWLNTELDHYRLQNQKQ